MERISVIIPVYNVQNYLRQCVDSVLQQTYPCTEIILVDDGSVDESGKICDEYQKQNDKIVVIHKENGGLSDARNVGYARATGEYIFFLDSDDWIEVSTLEFLYHLVKQEHADIAVANYWYQYEDRKVAANVMEQDIVLDKTEAMKMLLQNDLIKNFAWGKLYRAQLLQGLHFPVGKLFEDVYWTHLIFDRATRVVVAKQELVHYRQRSDSISYQFDVKKVHILQGYMERRTFIERNYPQFVPLVDENIVRVTLEIYVESVRHFQWARHRAVVKELTTFSKVFRQMGIMNSDVDECLTRDYARFTKHPALYLVPMVMRRMRGAK